jgi:hypothetical protein
MHFLIKHRKVFSDMRIGKDCTDWKSVAMNVSGNMHGGYALYSVDLAQCKATRTRLG